MHKTKLEMINLNLQKFASCPKHFHHLGICIISTVTIIETKVIEKTLKSTITPSPQPPSKLLAALCWLETSAEF